MTESKLTDQEILNIEERQIHAFLRDVRPVGEEKSELYPEPQYFTIAFMTMLFAFPDLLAEIDRRGGPTALGKRMQRVLARCTALHSSAAPCIATWGREMWLDEPGLRESRGITAHIDGLKDVTDDDIAVFMRAAYVIASTSRRDGKAYPDETKGLGADYRILPPAEVKDVLARMTPVDVDTARDVLGTWAAVRSLSFLMEAETRDALMMHGPYETGVPGESLVSFECNDLRWSLYPQFPLPGGQRWELPSPQFPYPNLAVAMVFRDVKVQADRMGTLYVEPWQPENLVAAALITRGTDEFSDGDLKTIDLKEVRELRRAADQIQETMFIQIAGWELRQRMAAGHFQKMMYLLRIFSGAGMTSRAEIEAKMKSYFELSEKAFSVHFERILNTPADKLRFFARMTEFVTGKSKGLFAPYRPVAPT